MLQNQHVKIRKLTQTQREKYTYAARLHVHKKGKHKTQTDFASSYT
jgi:hypothetical protein